MIDKGSWLIVFKTSNSDGHLFLSLKRRLPSDQLFPAVKNAVKDNIHDVGSLYIVNMVKVGKK